MQNEIAAVELLEHRIVSEYQKLIMLGNSQLSNETKDEYLTTSRSQSLQPDTDSDSRTDIRDRCSSQIMDRTDSELELAQIHSSKSELIDAHSLFQLLRQNKIDEFKSKFKMPQSQTIIHDGKYTYLQYACNYGLVEVVKTLLLAGANPNECSPNNKTTPMMISAERGYNTILELLLNRVEISFEPIAQKTVLHSLFEGMLATKNGLVEKNPTRDHLKCLKLLLKDEYGSKLDINFADKDGNTALHYAIKMKNDDVVKSLLNAGAYLGCKNRSGKIALKSIPAHVLESCLDKCISTNGKDCDDEDYEIMFDYSMITQPNPKESASTKKSLRNDMTEMETLLTINQIPELRKLLNHPVLLSFLNLKWYSIANYFYFNLVVYIMFCLWLATYIFYINDNNVRAESNRSSLNSYDSPDARINLTVVRSINQTSDIDANISTENNNTRLQNRTSPSTPLPDESIPNDKIIEYVLRYTTFVLCLLLILRELYQFYVSSWRYFRSVENWLEITLISATLVLLLHQMDLQSQHQLSSVTIMLSWLELMLLIGRHPASSTNVQMLKTVSYNFFKFFAWYTILILAFAFSFYILFRDKNFFNSPFLSVIKTIIMLTGEFEAGNILQLSFDPKFSASYIIFVMFVFFVPIVLFNLLSGLAVSDIHAIRADAKLVGIVSTITLISYVEAAAIADPFEGFHFVHTIVRYCTLVPFHQAKRERNRHQRIFYEDAKLLPYLFMENKIRVLPNRKNRAFLKRRYTSPEIFKNTTIVRYFSRIDTHILNNAMKIIERNIRPESTETKFIRQNFAQFNSRLQNVENCLLQYNDKLEIIDKSLKQIVDELKSN